MIFKSFLVLTFVSFVSAQSQVFPPDFCEMVPDRTFILNIYNCQAYYKCEDGVLWERFCPPGMLVHQEWVECLPAHLVVCPPGNLPTALPPTLPPSTVSCPSGFTGIFPNQNDCSQFFTCRNGISRVQHCGPFSNFDVNLGFCRIRQFAQCA